MHGRLRTLILAVVTSLVALVAPAAAGAAVQIARVDLDLPRVDIANLTKLGLEVTENVRRSYADVLLQDDAQQQLLRDNGFTYRIVQPDLVSATLDARRRDSVAVAEGVPSGLPSGRLSYRVYSDYQDELDTLAGENPSMVRKITLPKTSVFGRDIEGVEISEQVNRVDDGKPVYVVMGAHHAREWPSAEVSMEFALDLVKNRATNPRFKDLLRRARVFVIPVINVDGFDYSRGADPAVVGTFPASPAARRKNCAAVTDAELTATTCAGRTGVDLNRNYGAYWGGPGESPKPSSETYRGPSPWSEPEAQAVHEFSQRLQITDFQTIHNVAALVLRPPGFNQLGLAPDEARLKELGDAMALSTGYTSEYGYELYPVTGATEDWNYVAQGAFGYTIETGPPNGTTFQGPYDSWVIDQYLGLTQGDVPSPGVGGALLLAGEQAADIRDHDIITGSAPAGATLRLRKDFETTTSEICSSVVSNECVGPTSPAMLLDDHLDTTMVVPDSGRFGWHVGPSTRPFVKKEGGTEAWTLTCELAGSVVATHQVTVWRGEVAQVDPCDPGSDVAVQANDRPLATTGAATGVGLEAATLNGLVNGLSAAGTYRFEYGTTTAYGTTGTFTALPDDASSAADAVSMPLAGLQPGTTYHYRVVAQRGDGAVVDGGDRTFTTDAAEVDGGTQTTTTTTSTTVTETQTQTTSTTGATTPTLATSGTGVTVPPPTLAPALRLSATVGRQLLRSVLGSRGLLVRARCTVECALKINVKVSAADAKRLRLSRRGIVSMSRASFSGRGVLSLRPSSAVRRRLAGRRGLAVTVTVTAKDRTGKVLAKVLTTRLS